MKLCPLPSHHFPILHTSDNHQLICDCLHTRNLKKMDICKLMVMSHICIVICRIKPSMPKCWIIFLNIFNVLLVYHVSWWINCIYSTYSSYLFVFSLVVSAAVRRKLIEHQRNPGTFSSWKAIEFYFLTIRTFNTRHDSDTIQDTYSCRLHLWPLNPQHTGCR